MFHGSSQTNRKHIYDLGTFVPKLWFPDHEKVLIESVRTDWKLVNDIRATTGGEIDVQRCQSSTTEDDSFRIRRMVTSGSPIFAEVDVPVQHADIKVREMNVVINREQKELFHVEKKLNDTQSESHDIPKSRDPLSSTPMPSVYLLNNLKTDIYIKDMNNNLLLLRTNNKTLKETTLLMNI